MNDPTRKFSRRQAAITLLLGGLATAAGCPGEPNGPTMPGGGKTGTATGTPGAEPENGMSNDPGARPNPASRGADGANGSGTIGISCLMRDNPFFPAIVDQVGERMRQAGYRVVSMDAENRPALQSRQLRELIEQKVDAILLIPCHSEKIGPVVREANEAEIPVFTADIAVLDPIARVVCHVATDNYSGGRLAAYQTLAAIQGEGRVAIVDWPGIESVQQRMKGFREVILFANREGSHVELIPPMPAYGDRGKAKLAALEILNDFPDVKAIFAINDPTAFGVQDALLERDRTDIHIIGFDGTDEAKKMVDQGVFHADIVQFPGEIAATVADVMIRRLRGDTVPSQILIPTSVYIRPENTPSRETTGFPGH